MFSYRYNLSYGSSIIRSKIVFLGGNTVIVLKSLKHSFQWKAIMDVVNIFLGPKLIILTLHTYLKTFLLILIFRICLSVETFCSHWWFYFVCFQQKSALKTFNVQFFSWRKRNKWTAISKTSVWNVSRWTQLFKIFKLHVAACSRL